MTRSTESAVGTLSPWQQIAIAFYLVGAMVVGWQLAVGLVLDPETVPSSSESVGLTMPIQGVVQLVILGLVAVLVRGVGLQRIGIEWWGRIRPGFHVIGAYALMMTLWVPFVFFVYPRILSVLGVEMTAQPHLLYFVDAERNLTFWFVLATVCAIGPILEEVMFRAFLQTGLRRMIGRWYALGVVSLLFGAIHGLDKALPLALMGAFFGYLRERDDGIASPIAAHCLHNTVTVLIVMQMPEVVQEAFGR